MSEGLGGLIASVIRYWRKLLKRRRVALCLIIEAVSLLPSNLLCMVRKAPAIVAHSVEYRSVPEKANPLGSDHKVCSMPFREERLPCGTFITRGAMALPVDLGSMTGMSESSLLATASRQHFSVAIDHCR